MQRLWVWSQVNIQLAGACSISFLNVYWPSDPHLVDKATGGQLFRQEAPAFIDNSCNLTIVVGNFNCVNDTLDTQVNFKTKQCRALTDFLATLSLVDCLWHLHPGVREYTFYRPGISEFLLDQVWIPPATVWLCIWWRSGTPII